MRSEEFTTQGAKHGDMNSTNSYSNYRHFAIQRALRSQKAAASGNSATQNRQKYLRLLPRATRSSPETIGYRHQSEGL